MPDAREIIARTIEARNTPQHGLTWGDCQERADAALSALREAGLIVVQPEQIEAAYREGFAAGSAVERDAFDGCSDQTLCWERSEAREMITPPTQEPSDA